MRGEFMAAPAVPQAASAARCAAGCEIDGRVLPDYVARSFEAGGFFPAPMSRSPPERRHGVPASFCVSWGGLGYDHNDYQPRRPGQTAHASTKRD